MVKHIMLWKLKEECNNDEAKNGIKTGLEALRGVIDGLVEIRVQLERMHSHMVADVISVLKAVHIRKMNLSNVISLSSILKI